MLLSAPEDVCEEGGGVEEGVRAVICLLRGSRATVRRWSLHSSLLNGEEEKEHLVSITILIQCAACFTVFY